MELNSYTKRMVLFTFALILFELNETCLETYVLDISKSISFNEEFMIFFYEKISSSVENPEIKKYVKQRNLKCIYFIHLYNVLFIYFILSHSLKCFRSTILKIFYHIIFLDQ